MAIFFAANLNAVDKVARTFICKLNDDKTFCCYDSWSRMLPPHTFPIMLWNATNKPVDIQVFYKMLTSVANMKNLSIKFFYAFKY